ncbi:MAG: energy transducer TonB [Bacteroidales bacterium]|nr:energy transducer TonB [Bacteroidales bacterium]
MISKKTNRANLESWRIIFLQVGFIASLLICLGLFNWSTPARETKGVMMRISDMEFEEEVIPVTRQERDRPDMNAIMIKREELSKTQGVQTGPGILRIVGDEADITDELQVGDLEGDQNTEVALINPNNVVIFEEEEEEAEEIFFLVEDMPKFNGGDLSEFQKYVQSNLVYPDDAKDNDISGVVLVKFVINKKGELTRLELVRGVHPGLDKEALRVVSSSPKWTPGKQRGMPASVAYTFPIRFVLQDK